MAKARDGGGDGTTDTMVDAREGTDWARHVDDLAGASPGELDGLFAAGDCPGLGEMDGRYEGAVLSSPHVPVENEELARIVNTYLSPWRGKQFDVAADPPRGHNVYGVGPFTVDGYGFESAIAASTFDGEDCYVFDYDVPDNPAPMRNVKDEIRRVADGLYLGRFYLYVADEYQFVTYFALQAR